jgi:excisionase family DNA binding protein
MNRGDPGPRVPATPRVTTEASARYLTAAQIAALLQVSTKSVYRWAAGDPTFPRLKIGGTVRFPREGLLRWLRNHEEGLGRLRMQRPVRAVSVTPRSTQG